ncbi:MAG: PDZ domain-containing protein [Methylophilaceae bacterium]
MTRSTVKIDFKTYILGGDIITSINDIALKDEKSLVKALDLVRIGAKLQLKIFRSGKIINSTLDIVERPIQPGDIPESSQSFSVYDNKGIN